MFRACLALCLTAAAGLSQGLGLPPLTDQFAACTGRLAAMMEHQWMHDDPAMGETTAMVEQMRELLAAVADPAQEGLILAREHEAKLAFERLLSRFGQAAGGAWARARAEAELAECRALVF